jgi:predicted neutral ceramidase superfamily lipid hydrolase
VRFAKSKVVAGWLLALPAAAFAAAVVAAVAAAATWGLEDEGLTYALPLMLHALALLLVCAVCAWVKFAQTPPIVRAGAFGSLLFLVVCVLLVGRFFDHYAACLDKVDDESFYAWAGLMTAQIVWLFAGGWLSWKLRSV